MAYKLFIDDERFPPESWVGGGPYRIARTSQDAIDYINVWGMPHFISFDHDLGGRDTSMVFLSWLTEELIAGLVEFPPDFDYYVHSQNPVGAKNITSLMENLLNEFKGD